jgi:quinol-cytochrome oxidoreductase complex cytochrome b subunit
MLTKVQDWLRGRKTYITAAIGVLGALAAFADHQIDLPGLLAAVWAAAMVCFNRAGVNNAVNQTKEGNAQ